MNHSKIYIIVTIYICILSNIKSKGILDDHMAKAKEILENMTENEIINSLFIVKTPKEVSTETTNIPSGYLFEKDYFKGKTKDSVHKYFESIHKNQKAKFIIAVEEEGGNFAPVSKYIGTTKFKLPIETLFESGKSGLINQEEQKLHFLKELHINTNLAPVADVSDTGNIIYNRTLGLDVAKTITYIKEIVKKYVDHKYAIGIKHFPGYGESNVKIGEVTHDNRTLYKAKEYLKPFVEAIKLKIPLMYACNLIIDVIDYTNPVSSSLIWSNILFNLNNYTGLVIGDIPLNTETEENTHYYENAIKFKYQMILTNNISLSNTLIKQLLKSNKISMDTIKETVLRILCFRLGYLDTSHNHTKVKVGVIVATGIVSFIVFAIIAYLLYKFYLSKKKSEFEDIENVHKDIYEEKSDIKDNPQVVENTEKKENSQNVEVKDDNKKPEKVEIVEDKGNTEKLLN